MIDTNCRHCLTPSACVVSEEQKVGPLQIRSRERNSQRIAWAVVLHRDDRDDQEVSGGDGRSWGGEAAKGADALELAVVYNTSSPRPGDQCSRHAIHPNPSLERQRRRPASSGRMTFVFFRWCEETRREGGAAQVIDARLRVCKVVIILLIWAVKSVGYVLWVVDLAGGNCLEKISIIVEI